MDIIKKIQEIKKLADLKTNEIDALLDAFEKLVEKQAGLLNKQVLDFISQELTIEKGVILNDRQNLRRLSLLEKVLFHFIDTSGVKIAASFVTDMEAIMAMGDKYYSMLIGRAVPGADQVKGIIRNRLGIEASGAIRGRGLVWQLSQMPGVLDDLRGFLYTQVTGTTGYEQFRLGLKGYLLSDKNNSGVLARYYRGISYDLYSHIDAMQGAMYAEKLKLRYFVYNGGIMRDKKGRIRSRKFCVERAGKVFSNKEAEGWVHDPNLTAIESKQTYQWQIDRGGYNCRHSIDYITDAVAFYLRPDLKPKEPVKSDQAKQR